jgi:hypothetical protein
VPGRRDDRIHIGRNWSDQSDCFEFGASRCARMAYVLISVGGGRSRSLLQTDFCSRTSHEYLRDITRELHEYHGNVRGLILEIPSRGIKPTRDLGRSRRIVFALRAQPPMFPWWTADASIDKCLSIHLHQLTLGLAICIHVFPAHPKRNTFVGVSRVFGGTDQVVSSLRENWCSGWHLDSQQRWGSPGPSLNTFQGILLYEEAERITTGVMSSGSACKPTDPGASSTLPASQSAMKQNGDPSIPHRTSKSFSPHVLESTRTVSGGTGTSEPSKAKRDSGKRALWQNITGGLPTYVVSGMRNTRSWKTFARCMIALFGALLVMLVQSCESGNSLSETVTMLRSMKA